MTIRTFIFFLLLASVLPFALTACGDSEGPAEQAGESIDQAAEQTEDTAEDAMDTMEEKAEEAGDSMEDAMDNAEDKMDEMNN